MFKIFSQKEILTSIKVHNAVEILQNIFNPNLDFVYW